MADLLQLETEINTKEKTEEFAGFILAESEMMEVAIQKLRNSQKEIQSLVDALIARYQIAFTKSFQFDIDRKTRIKQLRYEIEKEILAIEDWHEEHDLKKEILDRKLIQYDPD